jgi:hypothetical protein
MPDLYSGNLLRRHVLQLISLCFILKGGINKLIEQRKDHKIENKSIIP